jgi:hypothetical protein
MLSVGWDYETEMYRSRRPCSESESRRKELRRQKKEALDAYQEKIRMERNGGWMYQDYMLSPGSIELYDKKPQRVVLVTIFCT